MACDIEAELDSDALDGLLPLFIIMDEDDTILSVGRTMAKLAEGRCLVGSGFFDQFSIIKPRGIDGVDKLLERGGSKLRIRACWEQSMDFRGMAVRAGRHVLVNVSLGTKLAAIVDKFGLKEQDSSPADNSVELLYMIETQTTVIRDSKRLNTRLQTAKAEAEQMAMTDSLTGLPNRRALIAALEDRMKNSRRSSDRFALLHLDLDKFKSVNDTLGHAAGDEVLVHAAAIFRSALRDHDMLARIGGDEFVVVVSGDPSPETDQEIGARIIERISAPIPYGEQNCQIGASIGAIFYDPATAADPDKLLRDGDLALYESKRAGRGRMRVFSQEMREAFDKVERLSADIVSALDQNLFEPFFQPQVDMLSGRLCGFEALARWRHPERGFLPPKDFLYVADQAGLLDRIDDTILDKALSTLSSWRRAGFDVPRVSINVTAGRLSGGDLVDRLKWACNGAGVDPACVAIEVLESVLLDGDESAIPGQVNRLRQAGFRIDLDDFGTGHAAIANLMKFDVDVVKIDRSFVDGLSGDRSQHRIVTAIIPLLKDLGITPLAEGVETHADLEALRSIGCSLVQGYAVARPMSATEATARLTNSAWFCPRPVSAAS